MTVEPSMEQQWDAIIAELAAMRAEVRAKFDALVDAAMSGLGEGEPQ